MAAPTPEKERQRRFKAFEESKKRVPGGSITVAAEILGDVSKSALSRFLLNQNVKTNRVPTFTKEQCINALKAYITRHKKIPSREDMYRQSEIGVKWKTHWGRWHEFLEAAGVNSDPTKILLLDIETAPMLAMVWGTRKQYINHDWIIENGYILCYAAKWLGSDEMMWKRFRPGKPLEMLGQVHDLLDKAAMVVHYNGKKFDIPTLQREFLIHHIPPPKPFKQIDCLQTMWEKFSFPTNKLDYVAKVLKIGQKLDNEGPNFWKDCMAGKPEAWKTMEAYNREDVRLLEGVYMRIRPWISRHPNIAAITGQPVCPVCGSYNFDRDGTYTAVQLRYEQYTCGDCHSHFRGTKSLNQRYEKRFALPA